MKECDMFFPVQCVNGYCPNIIAAELGEPVLSIEEACSDCYYKADVDCEKCGAYQSDMCDKGTYAKGKEG